MKNLAELIAKYGDKEIDEKKFKELFDIKDGKVFIPKIDERYWFISEDGDIFNYLFDNDNTDHAILNHNEVYRTKEEAKFACEAQAFKVKMKRDFAKNSDELDWGDVNQNKYYMYYSHNSGRINWASRTTVKTHNLYTTNLEWLEQYIEDNEADIKKYVFEIKEAE